MWKFEFWKLEIKFGNQNFEELIWKEMGFQKFIWRWHFKKKKKFGIIEFSKN